MTRRGVSCTPLGPQGALILVGLCSAWQGLLPGHCVTTGGDNKLLLCLTGPTSHICLCTRFLTLVRLLLLPITLPLSCRTRSQILLLLMICSCPGCVLLKILLNSNSIFSSEVKLGVSHLDVPSLKHPPPLCLYRATAYSASITAYERCAVPRCIAPSPTIMSRNI